MDPWDVSVRLIHIHPVRGLTLIRSRPPLLLPSAFPAPVTYIVPRYVLKSGTHGSRTPAGIVCASMHEIYLETMSLCKIVEIVYPVPCVEHRSGTSHPRRVLSKAAGTHPR